MTCMFAGRLRTRLCEIGMNQSQLAKAAGVSNMTVSTWVNGESIPRLDFAARVADALGCSIDYLAGRDGTARSAADEAVKRAYARLAEAIADEKTNCAESGGHISLPRGASLPEFERMLPDEYKGLAVKMWNVLYRAGIIVERGRLRHYCLGAFATREEVAGIRTIGEKCMKALVEAGMV